MSLFQLQLRSHLNSKSSCFSLSLPITKKTKYQFITEKKNNIAPHLRNKASKLLKQNLLRDIQGRKLLTSYTYNSHFQRGKEYYRGRSKLFLKVSIVQLQVVIKRLGFISRLLFSPIWSGTKLFEQTFNR